MKRQIESPFDELLCVLQRPRAIVALLCLYHAKNKGLDMLLQEIGGSKRTGMARISDFYRIGLVAKHTDEHSRRTFYTLSEDGRQIAQKVEDILAYWKNACKIRDEIR